MATVYDLASESHYRPLSRQTRQIRLLTVLPGDGQAPVTCILRHAELDTENPPLYETISYVWGDARDRASIQVGGFEINVPASSEAAIRRVRLHDRERTIWIDAVCINQLDLIERGDQVSIMSRIYRQARCNLIHLGKDENKAADRVKQVLRKAQYVLKYNEQDLDSALLQELPVISELYKLPWFTRVWNVQEAVLASRNICYWGCSEFPFQWIIEYNFWLTKMHHFISVHSDYTELFEQVYTMPTRISIVVIQRLRETYERVTALTSMHHIPGDLDFKTLYIPLAGQQLCATDPRDHVFALAGLTALFHGLVNTPPGLRADYSKTTTEVYRDASRYIFQTAAWGLILYMINHRSQTDITLDGKPSWTFPWKRSWNDLEAEFVLRHSCTAGLQSKDIDYRRLCNINSSGDPQVLTLDGFILGTVAECSSVFTNERMLDYQQLRPDIAMIEKTAKRYSVSAEMQDRRRTNLIIAMLLTASLPDGDVLGFNLSNEEQLLEAYNAFLEYIDLHKSLPSKLQESEKARNTSLSIAFTSILMKSLRGRRFFSTDDGRLGLGPRVTQEGDFVAITLGMAWPCILRPVGKMHQIIGAAYVDRLMSGEVFGMGLELQRIDLC